MKKLTLMVMSLAVAAVCAHAQDTTAQAPSDLTPKVPPTSEAPPVTAPPVTKSPRSPEGDKPMNPDTPDLKINAIVIVSSRDQIHEEGVTNVSGLVIKDIPFLTKPDFQKLADPYIGKLLTENNIRDLEDAIILYCRQRGKIMVDVILPGQDISSGNLQLWFLEGKVGKITVEHPGRAWFSDKLILGNVRLHAGDSVDSTKLNEDLTWLNNNPFRQVDVGFKPGDKLGYTDVELRVDDRFPFRPYVGYEDSGTRFTGEDRLLAGFNWGNVFGLDQQLNYQYSTDDGFDLVRAHSASYVIPLPWRNTLTLYGSYVDGRAEFNSGTLGTTANVHSWQTSARYGIPLPDLGLYREQVSVGFDFKRGNNDLEAGGSTVLPSLYTDVAQFVAAYNGLMPDPLGQTTFGGEAYYSPGGITGDNSDANYNQLRVDSKANYAYGRATLERITRLPGDFTWDVRAFGQVASARLHPDEEIALGGYDSVRGYDERVIVGDDGWAVMDEIRTPALFPGKMVHVPQAQDGLQFLAFFDYGYERQETTLLADGNNPNLTLYSVGGGLRYTVRKNLSVRFDYGVPLTELSINEHRARGHVGVLLSF
jgi:hemolysin activation/secretion protein